MRQLSLSILILLAAATALAQTATPTAAPAPAAPVAPVAPAAEEVGVLKTNLGTMVFRFFEPDAPQTTAAIKKLVRAGFYDGKTFYRVVKGHVIQAGDVQGEAGPKVKAEFNRHPFVAGTVGLARDADPDSGTTEIFICHLPRPHLDGKYTAFGQLIAGQDVLEKIANVDVLEHFESGVAFHKPKRPVVIEKATIETRVVEAKPVP
jgi:cyclophilin family peptidyl-prolyl cis-trans isomerase